MCFTVPRELSLLATFNCIWWSSGFQRGSSWGLMKVVAGWLKGHTLQLSATEYQEICSRKPWTCHYNNKSFKNGAFIFLRDQNYCILQPQSLRWQSFQCLGRCYHLVDLFPFWYLGNYWKAPGSFSFLELVIFFLRVSRNHNYGYKVLSTSCLDLEILKYLVLFSMLLSTAFRISELIA